MTVAPTLAERDAFAAQAHARAFRRVVRSVSGPSLLIGTMFWIGFLVIAVAVALIVRNLGNTMSGGVLIGAEYSAQWFAFTMGIVTVSTITMNHLAAGGTRRSLFQGASVSAPLVGILYAVLYVPALLAEKTLFESFGWSWEGPGRPADPGAEWFLHAALSELVLVTGYVLVGIAVATAYQTHGVTRGTVLLVPSVALLFALDFAAGSGSGDDIFGGLRPETSIGGDLLWLLVAVAVLGVAAAWMRYHLSRLRLRPTK